MVLQSKEEWGGDEKGESEGERNRGRNGRQKGEKRRRGREGRGLARRFEILEIS